MITALNCSIIFLTHRISESNPALASIKIILIRALAWVQIKYLGFNWVKHKPCRTQVPFCSTPITKLYAITINYVIYNGFFLFSSEFSINNSLNICISRSTISLVWFASWLHRAAGARTAIGLTSSPQLASLLLSYFSSFIFSTSSKKSNLSPGLQ